MARSALLRGGDVYALKIAHVCLSNFYIDGFGYQENELVREHVRAGHEVLVIASTETIDATGQLGYVEPRSYDGGDGAPVARLPYRGWLPHFLARKLRLHPGVYAKLESFAPDTILFHGTCGWELRTVARYVRDHPETLFYIDSHEDRHNSARSFLSRELLHKLYYAPILRSVLPIARKILCVSTETIDFVRDTYNVPADRLELYPLGGHLLSDADYAERRDRVRQRLGLSEDHIMLVQSGKQTRRKKLIESLRALAATPDPRLRLFIAGVLHSDVEQKVETLVAADPRATFLGWQSRDELDELLCAADVYLQPGTQSATMQHSLCRRCAIILDDTPAHEIYHRGNGWLVRSEAELAAAIAELPRHDLTAMGTRSEAIARELLDYRVLADRVLRA